ncbi:multifunctional 2',3'-cyclic-nucleotide 2'-phosphodiesterase/3'-nucleotidase/5'-nucleotidase [Bacillus sp. NPDC077027]|uniref:multifunctional 2',3'-cyclic-nucleotide 2'-phosphodiesterase/3'-nucleotidase/5'-nucleotidase n=1 Tax=Bacillus sp. NPDC077027 TaxID=3390548 RepID=UPI003D04DF72
MKKQKYRTNLKKNLSILLTSIMLISLILPAVPIQAADTQNEQSVHVSILATTDVHANMMNYDYYSDKVSNEFGLAKTAELIQKHRSENPNTLLVDNGDLIQGTPLGEYVYKNDKNNIINRSKVHPIMRTLNKLNYDAGTLGNHEFNYGLDFLDGTIAGADFPIVNANVKTLNGKHRFTPYSIQEKAFQDKSGQTQTVKVGYIGFVPPQIMTWDKKHLDGQVQVQDIVESANETIPKMKEEGADIIIALAHTGIEKTAQPKGSENMVFDLATKTNGIDAIVSGHQHGTFPDASYSGVDKFDVAKGTINGIPVVMSKNWGSYLGVIDLTIEKEDNVWVVTNGTGKIESVAQVTSQNSDVKTAIESTHQNTLDYVRKPVGKTEADINSFFAQVIDDPSIQIVTDAQKWYAQEKMKNTQYENLPILSAGAPFKAGGRNGVNYYTNIAKGDLAIKNIGDLYLYDNTVQIVKLKGSEVRDWLEMSAGQFNQIKANETSEQALLNEEYRSYNFDVIDGVTYQIDVTEPAKYSTSGTLVHSKANRVKNLSYNGKPVTDNQAFLVVTNNYRASGGGGFPHLTQDKIVLASADENRQVLMDYIIDQKTINPAADQNWSISPVKGATLTFESSVLAKPFAEKSSEVKFVRNADTDGLGVYQLSFDEDQTTEPPSNSDHWKLTVMHTNDTHAHLDDAARRATKVKEVRANNENNILLDAGDVFSGDLYFTKWQGLADMKLMNLMKYDAMTFGNHEFDQGPSTLRQFLTGDASTVDANNRHGFEKPDFPIVSSNVDVSKEKQLRDLVKKPTTFKAGKKKKSGIYPYILLDVNGEKVAVFGLTTEDTAITSSSGPNITFNDAYQKAKDTVKDIQSKEKINKIIALTHIGYQRDLELAKKVKGIDLIIGGHTHTLVDKLKVVDNKEPTIVAQVKDYGQFLGKVNLAFDKKGVVQTKESSFDLITIDDSVKEDPEAKAILDQYKADIHDLKTEKVGKTDVLLDGQREHVRTKETNLGNFIADGMLKKAQESAGADLAITNGGGIRSSIEKGDITLGDILTVMPFGNTLYVADLKGSQIKKALEQGLSGIEEGGGAFPHVSGIEYTFTLNRPAGKRLIDVKLKDKDGRLSNIDDDKTYRVATNAFVGTGGDGYSVFTEAAYGEDLGYVDYEIFKEQIEQAGGSISPAIDHRVKEVFLPDAKGKGAFDIQNNEQFQTYVQNTNKALLYLDKTNDAKNIKLSLSKTQITQLLEREQDPRVTIYNDILGLELPLSNVSKANTDIYVAKTKKVEKALTDTYDFRIMQNKKNISTFKEAVGLSFFLTDTAKAKKPAVYYVDRKNNRLSQTNNGSFENGVVTGYTEHFSEYTVLNKEEVAASTPGNGTDDDATSGVGGNETDRDGTGLPGGTLPNTATKMYTALLIGVLMLSAGGILYYYQRKRTKKDVSS